MKIGCHVSIAGGVFSAPANAGALDCEVFQIFTRSPRGGPAPVLTDEIIRQFREATKDKNQAECVVHTPYYINFGSKNPAIADSSVKIVREELERASKLGCAYVVTHLGSYKDLGREKGLAQLIRSVEKILKGYRGSAVLLLENSAGSGEQIGGTFEELDTVLKSPVLKNAPLAVCFDTCHAFASGYDLRNEAAMKSTMAKFDRLIGLGKIRAIHANDSKFPLSGNRDRHEHIGKGHIGLEGFRALVNFPKLKNVNMYLETEHDFVKKDIEILKKLRGK